MKRILLIFWLVTLTCVSLKGNEVKVVRAFEQIEGSSVSLARSEWKRYLNRDAKVPMEYSIFRVRINGNTDAVKKAKSSFKLDLGSQLIVKETYTGEDNEKWFLVPAKAKLVYLKCGDGCKECQIWSEQIIPDKVYYGEVEYTVDGEETVTHQYLVIKAEPQFSLVEIDGEMVNVTDGAAKKYVSFGRHRYRVSAKDYHAKEEFVDVNDADNKVVVNVTLDPAFGWINFTGNSDMVGADIYINDKMVGTVPMKTKALASGAYDVRIVKSMYKPFKRNVIVNDNQTTNVRADLTADFAEVTLKTIDGKAEIWVNDEKKGIGQWSGRLPSGEYMFETRRKNHKSQVIHRSISAANRETINLEAPIPICGKIMVETEPMDADILLDGVKVGTTPMMIRKVLIGGHDVVIRKAGCADKQERVNVTEDQTVIVAGRLDESQDVHLSCGIAGAHWTIDGVDRGTGAEITVNLSYAEHIVNLQASEYDNLSEKFTVSSGTKSKSFEMRKTLYYGSIEVDVKPYKSEVEMDGVNVGKTPLFLNHVLVGNHCVTVKATKYNNKTETLTVYNGRTSTVNGKLTRYVKPLYEREEGFQGMLDLNSNFTPSHWGIGADFILGCRLIQFYHVGGGLGLHSMLNVNMKDYNVFTTLYFNNIFYIPTHSRAFPMFDFALGCDFGWIGINQPYKFTSCGLYGKAGFGIETDYFNISTGYEYMGTHTAYVKIGFNFYAY